MAEHERSWRALREHWQKYEKERVHASEDFRQKKGLWQRIMDFLKGIFRH
ncbi:MAG: hypothetical protein QXH27_05110 [Candidatus Micrarchaeia archaeon]